MHPVTREVVRRFGASAAKKKKQPGCDASQRTGRPLAPAPSLTSSVCRVSVCAVARVAEWVVSALFLLQPAAANGSSASHQKINDAKQPHYQDEEGGREKTTHNGRE